MNASSNVSAAPVSTPTRSLTVAPGNRQMTKAILSSSAQLLAGPELGLLATRHRSHVHQSRRWLAAALTLVAAPVTALAVMGVAPSGWSAIGVALTAYTVVAGYCVLAARLARTRPLSSNQAGEVPGVGCLLEKYPACRSYVEKVANSGRPLLELDLEPLCDIADALELQARRALKRPVRTSDRNFGALESSF